MRDIYNEGSHACWGQGILEKPLYLPLNVTVKLKLLSPKKMFLKITQVKYIYFKHIKLLINCASATDFQCSIKTEFVNILPAIQFSSVSRSCLTLYDPTACSTPGFPVLHQLMKLVQTHVHRVGDAFQPSHPLSASSSPSFNLSQHQCLFK